MERDTEQSVSQVLVSDHDETDSDAEISNNNIPPRFLTQSQRTVLELDTDSDCENSPPHPSTPVSPSPPPSNDIGPPIMETSPETSARRRLPLLSLTQDTVLEHYVLTRAIDHWFGPKYETYNAKSARLQTFVIHDWPHTMDLPPNALSEAGFFFTGTFLTIF